MKGGRRDEEAKKAHRPQEMHNNTKTCSGGGVHIVADPWRAKAVMRFEEWKAVEEEGVTPGVSSTQRSRWEGVGGSRERGIWMGREEVEAELVDQER